MKTKLLSRVRKGLEIQKIFVHQQDRYYYWIKDFHSIRFGLTLDQQHRLIHEQLSKYKRRRKITPRNWSRAKCYLIILFWFVLAWSVIILLINFVRGWLAQ